MGLDQVEYLLIAMLVMCGVVLSFSFCVFQFLQKILSDERRRHSETQQSLLNRIMAVYPSDLRQFTQAEVQQQPRQTDALSEASLRAMAEEKLYGPDNTGGMV